MFLVMLKMKFSERGFPDKGYVTTPPLFVRSMRHCAVTSVLSLLPPATVTRTWDGSQTLKENGNCVAEPLP